jgi:hypothetical protein
LGRLCLFHKFKTKNLQGTNCLAYHTSLSVMNQKVLKH